MFKVKLISAPTVILLESYINEWIGEHKDLTIMGIQTSQARGAEPDSFILLTTILYEEKEA